MKFQAAFHSILASLTLSLSLISPLPLKAEAGGPNGPNNTPKPGWSLWQRWHQLQDADIEFGLSNLDLGLDRELQIQCFGEVDTPKSTQRKSETYWYRVSNDLNKIGTGQIEYGCWMGGRFEATIVNIAIKQSLAENPCFLVNSPSPEGLAIYLEPTTKSRLLRRIRNGETVEPSSVPVIVRTVENHEWIEIDSPVKGWISNGSPNGRGNLRFCQGTSRSGQ
ncbi:MAG: SH3 domain-containing protein [Actinomycetota bacterium]